MNQLNSVFFDELRKQQQEKQHGQYTTSQDTISGASPSEVSRNLQQELYDRLSAPMKAAYTQVLTESADNCFKDKHMAPTFTNMEQITLCRELKYEKYFGKFDDMMWKMRDSTRFRFQDCVKDASNDFEKAQGCVNGYLAGMRKDNDALVALGQKEFAKFM